MGVNRESNAWQSELLQIADLSDLTYEEDVPVRVVEDFDSCSLCEGEMPVDKSRMGF